MARVSFRVPDSTKYELEARAGAHSISQYMLAMIERDWHGSDQYEAITAALDDLRAGMGDDAAGDGTPRGLLVELLLLMRAVAGPEAQRRAQAEVDRLGLDVWSAGRVE